MADEEKKKAGDESVMMDPAIVPIGQLVDV